MTGLIALFGVVIVTGWIAEQIADLVLPASAPRHWAPVAGYGGAAAAGLIGGVGFGVWVSVLAPVGAMVPVLCLAGSLKRYGLIRVPDVAAADLVLFALLCLAVLLPAAGLGPVNPYAWFYGGPAPALLTAALALWAFWRKQAPVLVGLILAQALWVADLGSSNFYDQVSHAGLPAALLVTVCARAVARLLPQRG